MVNPLKTEHALDWSKTAQEIEDQFQAGMIERDHLKITLGGTLPWLEFLLANHTNLAGLPQDIENIKTLTK